MLTKDLMHWFFDHYVDAKERTDPRVAPLRAGDLSNLPLAVIVTCEFDPLRDEGVAYANALEAAGNEVRHISGRGHNHTSLTRVDVVLSGALSGADGRRLAQLPRRRGPGLTADRW